VGRASGRKGLTEPGFSASPFGGFGPEELLNCYATGVFPMGEARDDPRIFLVEPDQRGVIPLDGFHIPTRLKRTVRGEPFEVRVSTAFDAVLDACARPGRGVRTPGSTGRSAASIWRFRPWATPIQSNAGRTSGWWAACTA
jgi:Leu/Phe-tRNA-protein transferase